LTAIEYEIEIEIRDRWIFRGKEAEGDRHFEIERGRGR
jgi:hypothetical protein